MSGFHQSLDHVGAHAPEPDHAKFHYPLLTPRKGLGSAQQLSPQPVCPPIVITGPDPVICTSTVPREITGSSPVMTRRDAPPRLVYCWASPYVRPAAMA